MIITRKMTMIATVRAPTTPPVMAPTSGAKVINHAIKYFKKRRNKILNKPVVFVGPPEKDSHAVN